jgi:hypothetical protein
MGEYDKVIKENIEAILLTLSHKLLGFTIHNPRELADKLQITLEREVDFVKLVTMEDGSDVILHLEFQTNDDSRMIYRMAEYRAILQRKYEIPVKQFVIYLGTADPKMRTTLLPEEEIKGFVLKDIHKLPLNEILESDVPEEIVLSILTDYPLADAEVVIGKIIQKLKNVAQDEASLKKSLQQLVTLSRMRKLEQETEKQVEAMPITYDIETDYLYNKGIAKGLERGIEKQTQAFVLNLLSETDMSIEQIAKVADVSASMVMELKKNLKK